MPALTLPEMPLGSANTPFSAPFLMVDEMSESNELPSVILYVLETYLRKREGRTGQGRGGGREGRRRWEEGRRTGGSRGGAAIGQAERREEQQGKGAVSSVQMSTVN